MLGAIAGDIIGSIPRSKPCRDPVASLIGPGHHYTATTILTVATAHALLSKREPGEIYQKYAGRFPEIPGLGIGPGNPDPIAQVAWVSPVGWAFPGIGSVMLEAAIYIRVVGCEKGKSFEAQALAAAIYWAKCGLSKEEIRAGLAGRFSLNLDCRIGFEKESPLVGAMICFLESDGFEQTVQKAVSGGGPEVGSRAAIAGALAEAYDGGLPPRIVGEVSKRLPTGFLEVVHQFYSRHRMSVFVGEPISA